MTDNRDPVQDHLNGISYGGKILSLIPAPQGWFVGTQVSRYNRKTRETEHDTAKVGPLIGWALVDAMFRDGARSTQVEPLFLSSSGDVTHMTEFRWREGAGDVDEEGWSMSVAVDVIPAPGALENAPAYGERGAPVAERTPPAEQ
ncbi:hypothetical protein [Streptomyces lancefieldiae]|uniref:Uncharacterized protein n=1 Tax=Streptomyces lancefieldiae TaxID=3075520 RepID=A0ABU3AIV2_9ACTN|nr:hypothetical protein [Streptomyces sp. DSM 40712]MDT0608821.1 hypothetical protein [Streptomyces sp. DSM 40712]